MNENKKIDWEWLMTLPKYIRDLEIKKIVKKQKDLNV